MSKVKHTPGPWTLWEENGGFNITVPGAVIASRAEWGNRAAESAANARLIAAAPDLFHALKLLLADGGPLSDPISRKRASDCARTAIAKAEGAEVGR